jgi:hypothetical protein
MTDSRIVALPTEAPIRPMGPRRGPCAATRTRARMITHAGVEICPLDVARSSRSVWAKTSKGERNFFVRMNNLSRVMTPDELDRCGFSTCRASAARQRRPSLKVHPLALRSCALSRWCRGCFLFVTTSAVAVATATACFPCKSSGLRLSLVPARVRAFPTSCTRLVPAVRCLFAKHTTLVEGVRTARCARSPQANRGRRRLIAGCGRTPVPRGSDFSRSSDSLSSGGVLPNPTTAHHRAYARGSVERSYPLRHYGSDSQHSTSS